MDALRVAAIADEQTVVESMQAYYAQRAACYERVYQKPERQTDLRAMQAWLPGPYAQRRVLEIACGTGWWTPHGARDCAHWLATDLNPETLAIARGKPLPPGKVEFAVVDAYAHEVLKNFPTRDEALAAIGPRARIAQWIEHEHYWVLSYELH